MAENLKESQEIAAAMIATGSTMTDAAKAVGVTDSTLSVWRRDAAFIAEINARKLEILENVADRARAVTTKAINLVCSTIENEEAPLRDRLTAAYKVLELTGIYERAKSVGLTNKDEIESERRWKEMTTLSF